MLAGTAFLVYSRGSFSGDKCLEFCFGLADSAFINSIVFS